MASGASTEPVVKTGLKVKPKILTTFTTQLSTLQDAGLPIVRSIKILEGQQKPGNLKKILNAVAEDVEGGSTFSDALAKHNRAFDKLYVNMVKAGEMGGVLDTILRRLAEFMEKSQKLKKKIMGASVYPIAVMSVAGAILMGIMVFVVPSVKKIFLDLNVPLPALTELLIAMSDNAVAVIAYIPVAIVLFMVLIKVLNSNPTTKLMLDRTILMVPVIGDIIRKSSISRFTRTLGTLVSSGVPILDALNIVKGSISNQVIANAIQMVYDSIREGESIAAPLAKSGEFDDIVVNMIDVGEETGELDKMLIKIADNYDEEVDILVEAMVSLLEPIMIVGMGVVIGFIVIALFLPLIKLVQALG